jgi:hypothetical protein
VKKVLKEIRTRGDIILFIDELHTLVGAGAAEGAIDADADPFPAGSSTNTSGPPRSPGQGPWPSSGTPQGRQDAWPQPG